MKVASKLTALTMLFIATASALLMLQVGATPERVFVEPGAVVQAR